VSEGRSFYGAPKIGGRLDWRLAAAVVVVAVAGVGVAVAKPWGGTVQPGLPSRSPIADATRPAASPPAAALHAPSAAPPADARPLPVAFTTPLPPVSATWTGLDWRRLAPDDPLSLVTSEVQWRRGSIAVGSVAAPPATPIWTSADGTHWDPLISGTSTTFWPGLNVLGLAELRTGLVALTETLPWCGGACAPRYVLPVLAWTSADGRKWTPNLLLPVEWLLSPTGAAPLFAVGPAGLVVATSGPSAHFATSTDGSHWTMSPQGGFPANFALNDLRGTATGYVAVGRWTTSGNDGQAASLWSADGRHWLRVPTLLPTSPRPGSDVGSTAVSLVVGRNGMVAVGHGGTSSGAALWWQSSDGRRWHPLRTFAPLGPTTCAGNGCSVQPSGMLVGDGRRMIALRGGADAGVWTSTDGRTWSRLRLTGDLPGKQATEAALLPGGVIVSDGTTTWFGQAQGP
jgi:hypothetical protein